MNNVQGEFRVRGAIVLLFAFLSGISTATTAVMPILIQY
jgi:hypothetical protein